MKKLLLMISVFLCVTPLNSSETQFWSEETSTTKITDDWKIFTELAFRWEQKSGRLFEKYTQVNLDRRIGSSLWVSPGYRYGRKLDATSKWKDYQDALFDIKKSWNWNRFEFSNRSRFEYQLTSSNWLFRERLVIAYPLKWTVLKPFFNAEFFFPNFDVYNQNRLKLGIEFPINPNLNGTLSYMQRWDKSDGSWSLKNVINADLSFSF